VRAVAVVVVAVAEVAVSVGLVVVAPVAAAQLVAMVVATAVRTCGCLSPSLLCVFATPWLCFRQCRRALSMTMRIPRPSLLNQLSALLMRCPLALRRRQRQHGTEVVEPLAEVVVAVVVAAVVVVMALLLPAVVVVVVVTMPSAPQSHQ
jgi:hypothetical protein